MDPNSQTAAVINGRPAPSAAPLEPAAAPPIPPEPRHFAARPNPVFPQNEAIVLEVGDVVQLSNGDPNGDPIEWMGKVTVGLVSHVDGNHFVLKSYGQAPRLLFHNQFKYVWILQR